MAQFSKSDPPQQEVPPTQTDQSEPPVPDTALGLNVYETFSEDKPGESDKG